MKKSSFKFIVFLLFQIFFVFVISGYSQGSSEASKTVEEFYKFHLSNEDDFSKEEIDRRKHFFTEDLYNHFILKWNREVDEQKKDRWRKPDFEGLPFQPGGEVCKHIYKIKSSVQNDNDAIVKVDFYYHEDCDGNYIDTYEIKLLKIEDKWLIDDVGDVKARINQQLSENKNK